VFSSVGTGVIYAHLAKLISFPSAFDTVSVRNAPNSKGSRGVENMPIGRVGATAGTHAPWGIQSSPLRLWGSTERRLIAKDQRGPVFKRFIGLDCHLKRRLEALQRLINDHNAGDFGCAQLRS